MALSFAFANELHPHNAQILIACVFSYWMAISLTKHLYRHALFTFQNLTTTTYISVGADDTTPPPAVNNFDFDNLVETRFFSKNFPIGTTANTGE